MDINDITKTLPHRYPFLMLDKILEMKKSESIVALKNVTINEPFFQGHYPGNPIMPGVMIIEALAQAGAYLAIKSDEDTPGKKIPIFGGIDNARFRRPVVPGDALELEVTVSRRRGRIWWLDSRASVDGETACKLVIKAVLHAVEE
ncbi:MAG: 3-hydroxyacyl-[acyl-carrier-protein] dehydratase FabZ [bacterium]|nr:MAG: 3-hydroxyacyl-[acyl-carrier-protein] dehydratase FabZ [bacterium]